MRILLQSLLLGITGIAQSILTSPLPSFTERSLSAPCDVNDIECTQTALAFVFLYGFPLYAFGSLVQPPSDSDPDAVIPLNRLVPQRQLRTAEDKEIVRPNADTLYTNLFIDLSQNDLVLKVPDLGDRNGVVPFYDFYGNNFANIGSASDISHGTFLIQYDLSDYGIFPTNSTITNNTGTERYDGIIRMPTPYGQSIIRIVTSNTTADLALVHDLQDQFSLRVIPRNTANCTALNNQPIIPPLDLTTFSDPLYRATPDLTTLPEAVLRLIAKYAPLNLPLIPFHRPIVAQALENAGCNLEGTWTLPRGANLTAAVRAANASAAALAVNPASTHDLGAGWTVLDEDLIGDFGGKYVARYIVTGTGYLALTADQAMYPSHNATITSTTDNTTTQGLVTSARFTRRMEPGKSLLIRFSRRPPVKKDVGFWSVTMYGADLFFVPNERGVYAVGDRSGLRFPDGTLVYSPFWGGEGGGEDVGDGGPFDILVQDKEVEPPQNWTANWLPAPSGGEEGEWNLRWYAPEAELSPGGGYEYPKVEVINSIVG